MHFDFQFIIAICVFVVVVVCVRIGSGSFKRPFHQAKANGSEDSKHKQYR